MGMVYEPLVLNYGKFYTRPLEILTFNFREAGNFLNHVAEE